MLFALLVSNGCCCDVSFGSVGLLVAVTTGLLTVVIVVWFRFLVFAAGLRLFAGLSGY